MDFRRPLRHQTTAARAFLTGACCGVVCGAIVMWLVLAGSQGAFRTRATIDVPPGAPAGGAEPAATGTEGSLGDASSEGASAPTAGTTGTPVAVPHPVDRGVEPAPAGELAARELLIPVEGVSPGDLVGSFSDRRGSREHQAIDILAPRNTPVVAVEDGTIARLFESAAGGLTVYQFDPTRSFCYYYAHLERYAAGLAEGDAVRKGQVLGYVGTSGNAPENTPHLHFAIFKLTPDSRWWEGTPVDPFEVLGRP